MEKALRKVIPDVLDLILTPLLSMIAVGVVYVFILMPVTGFLSDILVGALSLLINSSNPVVSIISGYVMSAVFLPMVLLGLHHGLIPIYAVQLETLGGVTLFPCLAMAGAGQVGAALAIYLKARQVNNLRMQQTIIDTLDQGKYVLIKGMRGNKTNMKVMLHTLTEPLRQTNFENCVADVNIPVGEVFTSPVLTGTEGVLHVSRVYLNEMEYKNMTLTFQDGMITDYDCSNFDKEEQNRKYIKDNVLCHHDTLPLGEFAIGTNTTAFVAARKYGIEDRLPILIAEKTGPHFAVGDTCYSHAEEVAVYNPDGKEIIARDNEHSIKRKEGDPMAYFNCHTDITIPYDELGEVSVVTYDERVIPIIEEGRFVLPGCEELNIPLEDMKI